MLALTQAQLRRATLLLAGLHIVIIAASNYLVQLPVQAFGITTTWGTFTFPLVYLATDLTVRLFGSAEARSIIVRAMLPALLLSYLFSATFSEGSLRGLSWPASLDLFLARIALASFIAYTLGQMTDIRIFSRLRRHRRWWVAPASSTVLGNLLDTVIFYSLAFTACPDPFLAAHWPELALADYGFKLLVSIVLFLPVYGVVLRIVSEKILAPAANQPSAAAS